MRKPRTHLVVDIQTNWSLVAWPNMNVDTNSMMVRLAGAAAVG